MFALWALLFVQAGEADVRRPPSTFRFQLHIDDDGTMTFSDRSSVGVTRLFGLACEHLDKGCFQAGIEAWLADPYHFYESVRDRYIIVPPLFGAHFDLNEVLMRARGEDPHATEKRDILDRTREDRVDQAAKTRPARLSDALSALMARIRAIWNDESIAPSQRRARLFQIWDECDEDTRAGTAARHLVERFIREVAPAGSTRAYPDAQLGELNRQRASKRPFAPYTDSD